MFKATIVVNVRGKDADIVKQYLLDMCNNKDRVTSVVSITLEKEEEVDS